MKVLHVVAGNLFGGVEAMLVTFARAAQACPGMTTEFALCFSGRLKDELERQRAAVHLLGAVRARQPWTVWTARRRLARLIEENRYAAVVCHSAWAYGLFGSVARRLKKPLVLWLHDVARGKHWVERWAKRTQPDLVVCNSDFTAQSVPRLYRNAQFEVIYCPVPPSPPASAEQRRATRIEFNAPPNAVVIVQASRIQSWKGQRTLLAALGQLRATPDWRAWIIGGPQRASETAFYQELLAETRRLGLEARVTFLGQRSDVPRLLAAADVYCQPNASPEPFGIVFVEALLAGLPVVTSALGGPLEILDETCGRLTPPGDATAVAAALQPIIDEPALRQRLAQAGPSRAKALCDPAARLNQLQTAIARLAESRTP